MNTLENISARDWFATNATEEDLACFIPRTVEECADLFHKLGYGPRTIPQDSCRYMVRYDVSTKLRYWARYKHADAMLKAREGKL